jgi:hypothetical protein
MEPEIPQCSQKAAIESNCEKNNLIHVSKNNFSITVFISYLLDTCNILGTSL